MANHAHLFICTINDRGLASFLVKAFIDEGMDEAYRIENNGPILHENGKKRHNNCNKN